MSGTATRAKDAITQAGTLPNQAPTAVILCETWVEVKVVNDRSVNIGLEPCRLYGGDGKLLAEAKTNSQGVARFDHLCDTAQPFSIQLPDILEKWTSEGKVSDRAKPDNYRRIDDTRHLVPEKTKEYRIVIADLTEEEKFQHFRGAYEDNKAIYAYSNPKTFNDKERRWRWGKGAVCNQHVNFFLGFWFNYNKHFTTEGSATEMDCLPMYSSAVHPFVSGGNKVKHRGYSEFCDPVVGFGVPPSLSTVPDPEHCGKAFLAAEYIPMGRYFQMDTGNPNDRGRQLIAALGNFNVYSLSDITTQEKRNRAKAMVEKWLKKKLKPNELQATAPWQTMWDLDDHDEDYQELLKDLRDFVIWDHHAGVLLKRSAGGVKPPTGTNDELWKFAADGSKVPGPIIKVEPFANLVSRKAQNNLHMAIWRLKPLRPGGFAPVDAESNAGSISIDELSRFIHWG
jgi:hypothetical protein